MGYSSTVIFKFLLPRVRRRFEDLLDAAELAALFHELAERPTSGAVIAGTGGARKKRWESATEASGAEYG